MIFAFASFPNNVRLGSWFLSGLPRHFHLLLSNCLVLSLFVFCGKSNKVTKVTKSYKVTKSLRTRVSFVQPTKP